MTTKTTRRLLLLSWGAMAVCLVGCNGGGDDAAIADSGTDAGPIDAGNQSSLPPLPRGIISTGSKHRPIDQRIIDHPDVTGFMVIDAWKDLETSEGVFDWTHIDSEVARARAADKVVRLAIHTGGDSIPTWVGQNHSEIKKVIVYDKFTGAAKWIPAYWDPAFIEAKRRLYEALGDRYKNEQTVFAISTAMVDPNSGDWSFAASTDEQVQSYLDAGFTEARFIDAYKSIIENGMSSFENKFVTTAAGAVPRQLVADSYSAVHQVLDYARAKYGDRLIIAKGSLNAQTPLAAELPASHHWQTMLRYSPNAAAQTVYSVTNDTEFQMNLGVPYGADQLKEIFWRAMQVGKSYNLRWIEPYGVDILNPALQGEVKNTALMYGVD